MSKYDDMIKTLARTEKTVYDRTDSVIKDMGKVMGDIVDYRYAIDHYEGNAASVLNDNVMSIKNSVALLETELDILEEMLGIRDKVEEKKKNRLEKIIKNIDKIPT